jgi:hypothetical protein
MNNRGATLVETTLVSSLLVLTLTLVFFTLGLSLAKIWLHFSIYEEAICRAESNIAAECSKVFFRRLEILGTWVKIESFKQTTFGSQIESKVQLRIFPQSKSHFFLNEKINLNLRRLEKI